LNYGAAAAPSFDRQPAKVCAILIRRTNSHLATCYPCRNDGAGADMALHEPHLILRDGTPVLIRRLVAEDAALIPIF
jgi:hypothetical protein